MGIARIGRLEKAFQQEEEESKPLNIILGSLNYTNDTMILCVNNGFSGFSGTIAEGKKCMEDHPENMYCILSDYPDDTCVEDH